MNTPILPAPPDPPTKVPLSDQLRQYLALEVSKFGTDLVKALRQTYPDTVVGQALDQIQFSLTITPAPDGVVTVFVVNPMIRRDPLKMGQALVVADGVILTYDLTDPPAAGKWTLRMNPPNSGLPPQQVVVGTAPAATLAVPLAVVVGR